MASGGGLALVPHQVGPALQWEALPAHRPGSVPTSYEAERDLSETVLRVARELAGLEVAGGERPAETDVVLAPGYPPRQRVAADRAARLFTACSVALADDGGSISAYEADRRTGRVAGRASRRRPGTGRCGQLAGCRAGLILGGQALSCPPCSTATSPASPGERCSPSAVRRPSSDAGPCCVPSSRPPAGPEPGSRWCRAPRRWGPRSSRCTRPSSPPSVPRRSWPSGPRAGLRPGTPSSPRRWLTPPASS